MANLKKTKGYKLYHLPILPYFLITKTFFNFRKKRYIKALTTLVIAVILSGIWLGGYTLTVLAGYQIAKQTVFEKTENESIVSTLTPTPTAIIDNFDLFNTVNDYREELKRSRVNLDNQSCLIAERIIENAWWTNNYNLAEYADICPECNSLGVSLAQDMTTVDLIVNYWKKDPNTNQNLKANYKYGCVKVIGNKVALVYVNKNTPKSTVPLPTISKDPIITCNIHANCGGGSRQLKKSECDQLICCQTGNNWSSYPNKTACIQAQNNYNSSVSSGTNYPPCTVYYSALGYSQTYLYTSPSQCLTWQQANSSSSNVYQSPTYTPTPTPTLTQDDSQYQDLLKQHQEACNQAAADWTAQKEQFYTTEYNNFSSSYEAVQELERRRQAYQQELYDAGCANTVSL